MFKKLSYPGSILLSLFLFSINSFPQQVETEKRDNISTDRHDYEKWHITFSLPWINWFYFKPKNEEKQYSSGFGGISTGVHYYYKKNRFLAFNVATVGDSEYFFPFINITPDDVRSSLRTNHFALTNNYEFRLFSFGIGPSFSNNNYFYDNDLDSLNIIDIQKKNQSFGLVSNCYYKLNEYCSIGFIYRPSFLLMNRSNPWVYEHYFGIDFFLKTPIK